ncbi:hypothetical protein Sme01_40820 [Sphaerisporangium melleum]|uniref:Uncharacterized protein n=1 Tax=Sphaerisporangium melleum TaxID=321316 RepID=A0A917RDF1_9ACTN|nr:hypothetical protein [Sphaerisporangium melleum]GGL00827.1 hypothetical protein GCM10007964_48620 [Sphaerisporangium melleum]GII71606.1 hypothetical protein Sme01_40820 [Sphaerisporangium melleum]
MSRATEGRREEPPTLWMWEADAPDGNGVCGVTDVRETAHRELLAALEAMPVRSQGTIRTARLDPYAHPYPCYDYGLVLVDAYRDEVTGAIVLRSALRRPARSAHGDGAS